MIYYTGRAMTYQAIEEYWYELDNRIDACDRSIGALSVYIAIFPKSAREKVAKRGVQKYRDLKAAWLEEQLRVEEWLIDHEAPGWTST